MHLFGDREAHRGRAVTVLTAVLLAGAPAAAPAAGTPALVSLPGSESATLEAVTAQGIYFTSSDADGRSVLFRRGVDGRVERLAERAQFMAEAAGGVVVMSSAQLVPADRGRADDLYLVRPTGPILLSGGAPDDAACGGTVSGDPGACFVAFGSVSPDGEGIVFSSDYGVGDSATCNNLDGGSCTVYEWRGGTVTQLDVANPFMNYRPSGGWATSDRSVVFAAGANLGNAVVEDPYTAYFPASGSPDRLRRQFVVAAADHRTVLTRGFDGDPPLLRWDGTTTTPVGIQDAGRRVIFLAASPDLNTVFYAAEDEGSTTGDLDLHVWSGGVDRRLTGAPVAGPASSTPAISGSLDVRDEVRRLSPDGRSLAFVTRERLTAADTDTLADVYLAGAAGGLTLLSGGRGEGVDAIEDVGTTGVAFGTTAPLSCRDTDRARDVYVRSGSALALATPGTTEDDAGSARFLPGGDMVFTTRERLAAGTTADAVALFRATPSAASCTGGPSDPAPAGGAVTARAPTLRIALRGTLRPPCSRPACRRRAVLTVTLSRGARVTVSVRRPRGASVLARRTLRAGVSRVTLGPLPRSFTAGRRYVLSVSALATNGRRTTRTLPFRAGR